MTARTRAHATVEAVWRIESARVIAGLARLVRDVGVAEELAQDALVAALEQWPRDGVPDNPGAWLMATAKHRAIDALRRRGRYDEKLRELGRGLTDVAEPELDHVGDDLLTLIFMACHPVLSTESRVALTLRLLGGLTTQETARALLVPEPTVAQRIVRAKKSLAGVRFEPPEPPELAERLASVLEVVYLIFNEGYAATAGDDWVRPALCDEALRLGRILTALVPDEAEVHGLVSLMEFQSSRFAARTDVDGKPILLEDQNRTRWDRAQIQRGVAALERAANTLQRKGVGWGPYALQAALAECHAVAPKATDTDWTRIVLLYDGLRRVAPSPVVELNRAVAVAMADPVAGPASALEIVDNLDGLAGSYLLPSVRAELLVRLGRRAEAADEFDRAATMTDNEREREVLADKAAQARRR